MGRSGSQRRLSTRRKSARHARIAAVRRAARQAVRVFLAAPLAIRLLLGAAAILVAWSSVNVTYQVLRKPTELFFPVSGSLAKTPSQTWRQYGSLFRKHSTAIITP